MFRHFESLVDPYVAYEETDRPPSRLWPFLRNYARPFGRVFALTAAMSVLVAGVEVWLIGYLGRLVDMLSATGPTAVWEVHGTELVLVAALILLVRPVLQSLQVLLLNNAIMPNFGTLIRWRAHRHVLRQPVGWFENGFAGRIANRIMQTPPAAGEAAFRLSDAIAYAIAYIIGAALLLADADPRLVLPLVIWLVLYGLLMRWTVTRVGQVSQAASDVRSTVTGRVVDAYTNIHSVKMFAHRDREVEHAKEAIEEARRTFQVEVRIFTIMDVCLVTLNGLLILGVVGWAIWLWSVGSSSLGIIAAASALVLRLNAMTGWIMWALSSFFRNLSVIEEEMQTIAQPITLTDRPDAVPLRLTEGRLGIAGFSHHYGRGSGGLDGIDLTIRPEERIGRLGCSGAGKSTLVKLILRFYRAEAGRIAIDGQDITSVTQESLRRQIGMVQQDSSLLHRSVRENILYGRPQATEAEVVAAAHDFILGLRDLRGRTGHDAHVGERGVKLSGGQRQRVAIARVMLKDAPILVLDEATSALLEQGGLYARFWARQSNRFLGLDLDKALKVAE